MQTPCAVTVVIQAASLRGPQSGVVEAGCKVVVGTCLKRAAMHWNLAGADAANSTPLLQLSGRFDAFWERRSRAARAAAA